MRISLIVLLIALAVAACSPAATTTTNSTTSAADVDPQRAPALAALETALEADIGQPVSLRVDTYHSDGIWAFVIVTPQTPSGGAIDWTHTKYAERDQAGVLDGDGATDALLQRQADGWVVREFAVGPTDVVYLDWAQKYGAPAHLIGP